MVNSLNVSRSTTCSNIQILQNEFDIILHELFYRPYSVKNKVINNYKISVSSLIKTKCDIIKECIEMRDGISVSPLNYSQCQAIIIVRTGA